MAGLAPVGVKQTRVSRASRSAMPVKASLGSNFTAGGRVDFNGQQLSLGVAPGSSDLDAIRSSFRKRAKDLHPDVNSAPDAAEEFRRLVSAFETLISYLASPGASYMTGAIVPVDGGYTVR